MDDEGLIERLKRLQARLLDAFAEFTELRAAAMQPTHRLNQWPYRERRASVREATPERPDRNRKPR